MKPEFATAEYWEKRYNDEKQEIGEFEEGESLWSKAVRLARKAGAFEGLIEGMLKYGVKGKINKA